MNYIKGLFKQSCFVIMISLLLATAAQCEIEKQLTDTELDQLLTEIEQNFGQIKTIKTRLTQEKNIHIFSETVISKGFCLFKAPGKLRLEFTEPFKSALIVNNGNVIKYEHYNDGWEKLNSGNKQVMLMIMKNITGWLKGRFRDTNLYNISAYSNKNSRIVLIPKNEEFQKIIESFEMGINSDRTGLSYITIHEKKKDYTKILFHNDVVDEDIPDIVFNTKENNPQPAPVW